MKFDIDKSRNLIIIALVIVFIIFIVIKAIFSMSSNKEKEDNTTNNNISNTTNITKNTNDEAKIKKLKKVSESERIRTYLGQYFKYIEKKDFESAYNLLYADFKENYFPTLEKFKEYIEKCKYPKMLSIKYNDLETHGYYYIVDLNIENLDPDAISSEAVVKENTKFVLKENDYNDYYLSFQL